MPELLLHCQYCGASFGEQRGWPRTCASCHRITFRNPIPVGVLLQPVHQGGRKGLLVIRRNIEPALGKLALPGGYVEDGEDWRQATCREAQEEAGLKVDPARLVIFEALSNPEGNRVLLFALAPAIEGAQLGNFEPTPETSERCVLFSPEELAFPLHTQVASRYLRDIRLTRRI